MFAVYVRGSGEAVDAGTADIRVVQLDVRSSVGGVDGDGLLCCCIWAIVVGVLV